MNYIYRLVYNRARQIVQIASERVRSNTDSAGRSARSIRRRQRKAQRRNHAWRPILLTGGMAALGLAGLAVPAWSATCTINKVTYTDCTQGRSGVAGQEVTLTPPGALGGDGSNHGATDGYANDGGRGALRLDDGSYNKPASDGQGAAQSGGSTSGVGGKGNTGGGAGAKASKVNYGGGGAGGSLQTLGAGGGGAGGGEIFGSTGSGTGGGGGGGGGGLAVEITGAGSHVNDGAIIGGTGGRAGNAGGAAGGGGAGVLVDSGAAMSNRKGVIRGGTGGPGYEGAFAGGGGGAGVLLQDAASLNNANSIVGGSGGNAGGGGGGGAGVAGLNFSLDNSGTISGGAGGKGYDFALVGAGTGGDGGAGIMGREFTVTNTGTVGGGAGGRDAHDPGAPIGAGGVGGVGIISTGGSTITTSGKIAGGMSGDGKTRADAVELSGGGNTLTLEVGSTVVGNVVSTSGSNSSTGDTLILGDDTLGANPTQGGSDSLDLDQVSGFATYEKTGTSTWTLTGTRSAVPSWTVNGGTLEIASDGSTGTGQVTVDNSADQDATLKVDAGVTLGNQIVLNHGATLDNTGTLTFVGEYDAPTVVVHGDGGTVNNSGGSISGNYIGIRSSDAGTTVNNRDGGQIRASGILDLSGVYLAGGTVNNDGRGSLISGTDGIQIYGNGKVVNTEGATISAAQTGVYIAGIGEVDNAAVSTITGGSQSVHIKGGAGTVRNAGVLTGDVLLDSDYANTVELTAGGSITGDLKIGTNTASTLTLDGSNSTEQRYSDAVTGTTTFAGMLVKDGTGTWVIDTPDLASVAGTKVSAGTLIVGDGGTTGWLGNGDIEDDGTLIFNRSNAVTFNGAISGNGLLQQAGSGTLILNGTSGAFTGSTEVAEGTLIVGSETDMNAVLGGNVTVESDATLGGYGTFGGNVNVKSGGIVAPGHSIGTLTVGGDLTVAKGGVLDFEFGTPGKDFNTPGDSDNIKVGGDLALNGAVLNVTDAGDFDPGLYQLFDYNGNYSETNGGLALGSQPDGTTLTLQKLAGDKQINLLNTTGMTLNIWNGNGKADADHAGGGDGVWSTTNPNWTDAAGTMTSAMQPQPGFAVFTGEAGKVKINDSKGSVEATGMQFAVDDYTLTGDTLILTKDASGNAPVIRVGNGTSASADMIATIENVLAGSDGFTKADHGILVLTGANTYTGGTTVNGGTLEIAKGGVPGKDGVTVDNSSGQNATLQVDNGVSLDNHIVLNNGAALDNAGSIANTTDDYAVESAAGNATVVNHAGGSIAGKNNGVLLSHGGSVTNDASTISSKGGRGVEILKGGEVNNKDGGHISGKDIGVFLYNGGSVINDASTISASGADGRAVDIQGTVGTVSNVNNGSIVGKGAGVAFDHGGRVTNGAGALIKSDHDAISVYADHPNGFGGALTLTNAGSIVGDVQMDPDAANVTTLTAGGSIAGDLDIGSNAESTLALNGANTTPQLYSDAVTGATTFAGALTKDGSGQWIIDNDDLADITGTTINAGTLQIGNGGKAGSIGNADITDDGTLAFDHSDDVTFTGAVSGTGALVQQGTGTLTLTGGNDYTGGTSITDGTLAGNAQSLQGVIDNHAALVFDQANDGAFAGTLSGNGHVTKAGVGTLTFDTDSSAFAGATTVAAGTLLVGSHAGNNAALGGNVTVDRGATLGGHGTIGGNVAVQSGGMVAPGNSIGMLHVAGDIQFDSGALYEVEANAKGDSDRIEATGKAKLGGDVEVLAANGDYAPQTDYSIITADKGITGTFDSINTNLAFLDPTLAYGGHNVTLTLSRNDIDFEDIASTPNQQAAASGLNDLTYGNPVYNALVKLTAPEARAAFDSLSGDAYANEQTALLSDSHYLRDAVNGRLSQHCTQLRQSDRTATADSPAHKACGHALWLRAYAANADFDDNGNAASMDHHPRGLFLGADTRLMKHWRVGLLFGASHATSHVDDRQSTSSSDSYQLGAYTGLDWGRLSMNLGAAYAWHDIDSSRAVQFEGYHGGAHAKYHAHTAQVFGELGYHFGTDRTTITPFARAAYVHLDTNSFDEQGDAAALYNKGQSNAIEATTLGLHASRILLQSPTARLRIHGTVGWQHMFGDTEPRATLAFDDSREFTVRGVPLARDAAKVDVGLDATVAPNLIIGFGYAGQFGDGVTINGAKLKVNWQF